MKPFFIFMTGFFLIACGNQTHDVQYYLDNPDILKETVEKCRSNPGNLNNTPNCINAEEAFRKEYLEQMKRAWKK